MPEINLLQNYPKTKRDLKKRAANRTEEDRLIARKFDKDFFDGDRKHGYGGFNYNPIYWREVVKDICKHYNLRGNESILDVGCGKGFMLYDFIQFSESFSIKGIDISTYAVNNSKLEVKKFLSTGNAKKLNFDDNSFDFVISINTIHNLEGEELMNSIKEIERVGKSNKFIIVDAYSNDQEKKDLNDWNLTAKTILHIDEWVNLFNKCGYTGDYYWFRP